MSVAKKASATALSQQTPVAPIDCVTLNVGAVRLEVVARVLRAPVTVEDRPRQQLAVPGPSPGPACATSLSGVGRIAQPDPARVARSSTTARYSQPVPRRQAGDVPDCPGPGTIAVEGPLAVRVPTPVGDVRGPERPGPGSGSGTFPRRRRACSPCSPIIRSTRPREQG